MNEPAAMRRIPQQARSQRRVNHILDTAERLFAEAGYENTTTNAIAARANVPIGSLYQFFPSKEAILSALIERYSEEMNTLLHDPAWETLPLPQAIAQLLDRLAAYDETHAGFKMMLATSGITHPIHSEIVQHVQRILTLRFPGLNPERCQQAAVVGVAIVKSLMQLSQAPDNLPAAQVRAEVKMALIAYLQAMLRSEGFAIDR